MSNAPVPAAAEGMPEFNRRAILSRSIAVAATLPSCTLISPAAASIRKAAPYLPASDDSDLVAACATALAARSEYNAICETMDEDDLGREVRLEAIWAIETAAREKAINSPAGSDRGLQAKARLLSAYYPVNRAGKLYNYASDEELLALSMAADILARAP